MTAAVGRRRPRVFAPGAFTWDNKGDAALVEAMLGWARTELPDADVILTSFTPRLDSARYAVPVLPMVASPRSFPSRGVSWLATRLPGGRPALARVRLAAWVLSEPLLRGWSSLYRRSPRLARALAPRRVSRIAAAADGADLTLGVPGGYLMAPRDTDDGWLFHLPTFVIADALGCPVVLGPCSVGPFAGPHRRVAERFLRLPRLIMVREDVTRATLTELGVTPARIRSVPDLAVAYSPGPPSALGTHELGRVQALRDAHGAVAGVSVREHNFPASPDPRSEMDAYLASVVGALEGLHRTDGVAVAVIPQTAMDLGASRVVDRGLRAAGVPSTLVDPGLSPSDLCALYASLDLVVGTRMHANILAMTMGTAVAAIAYQPKTPGILADLGLPPWSIPIEDVGSGRLEAHVRRAWAERDSRAADALDRIAAARERLRGTSTGVLGAHRRRAPSGPSGPERPMTAAASPGPGERRSG